MNSRVGLVNHRVGRLGRCGAKIGLAAALLGTAALLAWSIPVAQAGEKEHYVDSVISMIRLHSDAIRQLATHDFRYSRNLARHATGLQNTFGLLGPMEWHVSTSITLQKGGEGPKLTEDDFNKMADQCQKSMKHLYQASIKHVEQKSGADAVIKALDDVQSKCTHCHGLLDGVAPDVWGKKGS
ncbi:hypothetical protein SIID45300_01970 [Candidatus Magnetaquicoccaceae bacterium FCR-1]|uniref:Cytochrome c n=1 Tax=Candidatus Magnetaquiglobus chichijimensis TaxID=3141448 RepID=A0ABQ0C9T6_9PROT